MHRTLPATLAVCLTLLAVPTGSAQPADAPPESPIPTTQFIPCTADADLGDVIRGGTGGISGEVWAGYECDFKGYY